MSYFLLDGITKTRLDTHKTPLASGSLVQLAHLGGRTGITMSHPACLVDHVRVEFRSVPFIHPIIFYIV
jgi:hypothetical protein